MGNALKGKDVLVWIHDGGDPGELLAVPYQGDATYNPGKSAQISTTKNGKHPFQTDEGASITFSFEKERPALAIHTRLRTLSQSGDLVQMEYADSVTGGEKLTGQVLVTLGEEAANVEGVVVVQCTLSFVDDPAVGTVA